jgi:hypothetical protein
LLFWLPLDLQLSERLARISQYGACVRIPEYPPTHSDNMRPLVPEHSPTCDALP